MVEPVICPACGGKNVRVLTVLPNGAVESWQCLDCVGWFVPDEVTPDV